MATAPRSETLPPRGVGEGEEEGKERHINWAFGWLAHLWAEEEEEEEEGTNAVGRNLIWSTVDFLSP